jgi:hypothetical protein
MLASVAAVIVVGSIGLRATTFDVHHAEEDRALLTSGATATVRWSWATSSRPARSVSTSIVRGRFGRLSDRWWSPKCEESPDYVLMLSVMGITIAASAVAEWMTSPIPLASGSRSRCRPWVWHRR